MKYNIFETIKKDSGKITQLQEELACKLRSFADEIGQDKPIHSETFEEITEQINTLEKLQRDLIEKVGNNVSYADAMRFGRESFGGFFTITSEEAEYREAIEALGAEVLARGKALFHDFEAIDLLRSVAEAVRSQDAFEAAKSELRGKLRNFSDGAWVYSGLLERMYYFRDEKPESNEREASSEPAEEPISPEESSPSASVEEEPAAPAEEPISPEESSPSASVEEEPAAPAEEPISPEESSPSVSVEEEPVAPDDEPISSEESSPSVSAEGEPAAPADEPISSEEVSVSVSAGEENSEEPASDMDVAGSVVPTTGNQRQAEESFSHKKFESDFQGLRFQYYRLLALIGERGVTTSKDMEIACEALMSQTVIEDRLEKLYNRGYLYRFQHEGKTYWMIGRKTWDAFSGKKIENKRKELKSRAGDLQQANLKITFHPEWLAGVDPVKLLEKFYVPATAPIRSDEETIAEKQSDDTHIDEPVTEEPVAEVSVADTEAPEEPVAEAPVVEPVTEEPVAETEVPEEPVAEAPVDEPVKEETVAEAPVDEPVTEEISAEVSVEPAANEESNSFAATAEAVEADGISCLAADELAADCKTLMERGVTPHEAPEAFMKITEELLGQGRGIEAAFFLDTVICGDTSSNDLSSFVIVRDQIRQIARIPGWEPKTDESELLTVPENMSSAIGKALYYSVQLSHLAGFLPHCRTDAAPPTKEDFDSIGLTDSLDEYYIATTKLQEIPRQEGGYSREDLEAIVSAESRYGDFATKADELSKKDYKDHFSEFVKPLFRGEKLYSNLKIVASREIDRVEEVENTIKEIAELPSEGKEFDERVLQRGLENYLDNVFWPKVIKVNKTKITKIEDPGRGELLAYLEERTRFLYDWVCFIRSSHKLRGTKKYQRYTDILCSLEKLRDSLSQGALAAGVLRFAAERIIAYLKNERIGDEFDFILTGNEFLLDENGLPEKMTAQPRLPAPWYCMLRQLSAPPLTAEKALSAIESGEEGERMGNYRTAEALAARLETKFTRPYEQEELRRRAEKEIASFDSETEKDCLYARIEDPEKEELNTARDKLKEWYLSPKLSPEYGKLLKGLRDLRTAREHIVAQQEARFREQIEVRYRERYADTPLFAEVERLIGEKNFAVAEEWLARLEEGETQPPSETGFSARPEVGQFLESDEEIYKFANSPTYKNMPFETWALQKCKGALGDGMTEAEAKRFYHVWPWGGKSQPAAFRETVKSFLRECGFELGSQKGEEVKKNYTLFRYTMMPLDKTRSSYLHPIREFGTGMKELKVICYTATPRSAGVVEAVNDCKPCGSALIVLCKDSLSRATREEILNHSKENSRENPFLLIDPVLAFYLGLSPRDTRLKTLLHCTLPYTFYNPFGRDPLAPEMFVPREALLHLRKIEEPTALVYGGRQLGKTALLRRACEMEDAEDEQSYAVYVSVQPSNGEDPKDVFVQKLSDILIEKNLIGKRPYKDNQSICKQIRELLKRRTALKLRLYIDEMDDYFKMIVKEGTTNLFVPFVDLRREYPERFKFVFAGLHHVARQPRMLENNSVFGQLQQGMSIGPLKQYEAWSLIQRPFSFLGIRIEPSAVELIATRANFYPGIIQEICKEIVQTIQSRIGGKPPYFVDEALLQKVCEAQRINQIISEKIMMTLTLDRSYEAIAKLFAHHYFEAPLEGYTPEELSKSAKDFADGNEDVAKLSELSSKELEILLDELVDMSILRPGRGETDGTRRFMLRKASFARQIGTEESLTNYLLGMEES